MGLLVSVYRNSEFGDCTNGGISKFNNSFCISNVDGPVEPNDQYPELILVKGPYNTPRLVPVEFVENHTWCMFGGNYAGTSDSRLGEAVAKITGARLGECIVKIFDRVE